jgi:hypothetical protein
MEGRITTLRRTFAKFEPPEEEPNDFARLKEVSESSAIVVKSG